MDIETRCNATDGFVEFQWYEWALMLAYDFRGWRLGFSFRDVLGWEFPCFSLNLLCFDIHLHRWNC